MRRRRTRGTTSAAGGSSSTATSTSTTGSSRVRRTAERQTDYRVGRERLEESAWDPRATLALAQAVRETPDDVHWFAAAALRRWRAAPASNSPTDWVSRPDVTTTRGATRSGRRSRCAPTTSASRPDRRLVYGLVPHVERLPIFDARDLHDPSGSWPVDATSVVPCGKSTTSRCSVPQFGQDSAADGSKSTSANEDDSQLGHVGPPTT